MKKRMNFKLEYIKWLIDLELQAHTTDNSILGYRRYLLKYNKDALKMNVKNKIMRLKGAENYPKKMQIGDKAINLMEELIEQDAQIGGQTKNISGFGYLLNDLNQMKWMYVDWLVSLLGLRKERFCKPNDLKKVIEKQINSRHLQRLLKIDPIFQLIKWRMSDNQKIHFLLANCIEKVALLGVYLNNEKNKRYEHINFYLTLINFKRLDVSAELNLVHWLEYIEHQRYQFEANSELEYFELNFLYVSEFLLVIKSLKKKLLTQLIEYNKKNLENKTQHELWTITDNQIVLGANWFERFESDFEKYFLWSIDKSNKNKKTEIIIKEIVGLFGVDGLCKSTNNIEVQNFFELVLNFGILIRVPCEKKNTKEQLLSINRLNRYTINKISAKVSVKNIESYEKHLKKVGIRYIDNIQWLIAFVLSEQTYERLDLSVKTWQQLISNQNKVIKLHNEINEKVHDLKQLHNKIKLLETVDGKSLIKKTEELILKLSFWISAIEEFLTSYINWHKLNGKPRSAQKMLSDQLKLMGVAIKTHPVFEGVVIAMDKKEAYEKIRIAIEKKVLIAQIKNTNENNKVARINYL